MIDEHSGLADLTEFSVAIGFVKQADNDVTRYESKCIMADRGETWSWEGTADLLSEGWERLECLEWEDAENMFLEVYVELAAAIKPQVKPVEMSQHQILEAYGSGVAGPYVEVPAGDLPHAVMITHEGKVVDSWGGLGRIQPEQSAVIAIDDPAGKAPSSSDGEKIAEWWDGTLKARSKSDNKPAHRTHETGATRSTDADEVRFDLITPVALREIGKHKRRFCDIDKKAAELVETARDSMLAASYGDWNSGQLERAAYCLLDAINEVEGGVFQADGLPFKGMERLAAVYKEGADKYSDHNWLRGFGVSDLLNHAIRHLFLWLGGDRSEDHLGHACWGVFASIHSYHEWPHLNKNLRVLPVDAA